MRDMTSEERLEWVEAMQANARRLDLRNRVIPADDWQPTAPTVMGRSVDEVQADTEAWWAGIQRLRRQGHLLP